MKIGTHLVKFGVAAAVAGALVGSLTLSGVASASGLSQVRNSVPDLVGKSRMQGHHNPSETLAISVALSLQNTDKLQTFIRALHDRSSPYYHKYLTPALFTALYGPSPDQVRAVKQFLKQHGIRATGVSANNTRVYASASVATLESAFGVAINDYVAADGTRFYATSTDPSLPATISPYVKAVMGMDNAGPMQSHMVENKGAFVGAPHAVSVPQPSGFSPQQIATAYNWPLGTGTAPLQDTTLAGGVTIAIATAFSYRMADLTKFWSFYGLPTHTVTNVAIDGVTNRLEGETTLDIQRSSAMSPGSNIVVYEAANPGFNTFDDEFIAIANDHTHNIKVVSTSWGSSESRNSPASIAAEHDDFLQMTSEGMVILAAAGDNGASDGGSTADNADFPAVDPLVLASGGTHLVLNGSNAITSEVAWTGAGGADSIYFKEPFYQSALSSPVWTHNTACSGNFTAAYSAATQTTSGTPNLGTDGCAATGNASRQSSDMSMDADPATGYSLYFNGRWEVFGGTSFVAPELAGLFAIIVKGHGGSSDQAPFVVFCAATHSASANYATDFHDIISGANSKTLGGTFDAAVVHTAGGNWDHPTGWGSPNAANLVTDINANCQN